MQAENYARCENLPVATIVCQTIEHIRHALQS